MLGIPLRQSVSSRGALATSLVGRLFPPVSQPHSSQSPLNVNKKDLVLNGAVSVMAMCALVITGLVVRREFFPGPAAAAQASPSKVQNPERYAATGNRIGPATAPLTIVEFSDFQCPYCRMYAETLQRVRQLHGENVSIVFRHYPIASIHPHATDAALASECAAAQQKFEAYHDVLFQNQDSIGSKRWSEFAIEAGVPDTARFAGCMRDRTYAQRIEADLRSAAELGVDATPTSIINGMKISGVVEEAVLLSMIEEALARKRR